jgi:ELWxxDGT repeat protein
MSNGKSGGTTLVADIQAGPLPSNPDGLVAIDDVLYFSADDGVHGRELWRWDPATGVSLVTDIVPGPRGSLGEGPILVAGGTRAWFPAWTPQAGVELWSSDGTSTAMVPEIAPGAAGSHPRALTAIGGRLYFSADDGVHGQEPWSLPLP